VPTKRKDPVPQAPIEASDSGRAFRAEQPSQEPTAASGADATAASGADATAASGADGTDAEPSPSRPGRKPGAHVVRTR
jgi:hypothetical protein